MESKLENISNNQWVMDIFKGLIGSNLSLKNGIESDNFSSMLEKFSSKNSNDKNSNNIKKSDNKSSYNKYSSEINNRVRKNEIKKAQEDNEIKPIKTEYKEDAKEIEKFNEVNETAEENETIDENNKDVILKLDDELISKIISTLENTNKFSQNELQTIKDALKETSENFQELNLKDLFDNLKDFLESANLNVANLDEFLNDVKDVIKEFFDENKITLKLNEINSDTNEKFELVSSNTKEDTESNDTKSIISTFEKILNDVFKSNLVGSENNENQDNTNLGFNLDNLFKNNNNKNHFDVKDLINSSFNELIKEGTIENSSIMNLENNFNNTQDFIKTLNIEAKNLTNIDIKNDTSLKSLDSVTSSRVLERVQEVLKAVSSSKDGSTISLRLDPPSLGEVKVDMSFKNGSLFARIIAESQEVENLLKSKVNELYQVLKDSGIDADNINVFIASKDNFLNFENDNENQKEALVKNSLKVIKDNSDQEETSEIIPNINQISDSKWIA